MKEGALNTYLTEQCWEWKYEQVGVLPIRIAQSNISSIGPLLFLSDEGPMLKTLDYTIHIGSTPTFFILRFVSLLCLRSTLRLFQKNIYLFSLWLHLISIIFCPLGSTVYKHYKWRAMLNIYLSAMPPSLRCEITGYLQPRSTPPTFH